MAYRQCTELLCGYYFTKFEMPEIIPPHRYQHKIKNVLTYVQATNAICTLNYFLVLNYAVIQRHDVLC